MKENITKNLTKEADVIKMTISEMIDFEDMFLKHLYKLKFIYESICNQELLEQKDALEGFVFFFADVCHEWERVCQDFEEMRTKRDSNAIT